MREIKYRAKRVTGETVDFTLNQILRHDGKIPAWVYEFPEVDKYISTHSKDRNGIEIFDGDKIKHCWTTVPFDQSTEVCEIHHVHWSEQQQTWYIGIIPLRGVRGTLEVLEQGSRE